jgi:hypothetical protein
MQATSRDQEKYATNSYGSGAVRFSDYGRSGQAQGLGEPEMNIPPELAADGEIQMSEEELAMQIEMYKRLQKQNKPQEALQSKPKELK